MQQPKAPFVTFNKDELSNIEQHYQLVSEQYKKKTLNHHIRMNFIYQKIQVNTCVLVVELNYLALNINSIQDADGQLSGKHMTQNKQMRLYKFLKLIQGLYK